MTHSITISAANVGHKGSGKSQALGTPAFHITKFIGSNNVNFVAGDYNIANWEDTSFGSTAYADFSTSAYNVIALNASGLAAISKTGITKFGCRFHWDVNNDSTGLSLAGTNQSDFNWVAADTADTTSDPYIEITFTVISGPANLKTYNVNVAANVKTINTNVMANVKTLDTNV